MEEFKAAAPKFAEWGVKVDDPDATFKEMDVDGGGQVGERENKYKL